MDNRSSLGLSKSPLADGYGGTLSSLSAELPVNRMNSSYTVSDSGSVSKLTALPKGTLVTLYFLAAPTFVNSASLVCPGGVNMVFAAGDSAILRSLGDNVWRLLGKLPASQAVTITDATASSLVVGPNGATNPTLQVDGSTASAATGLLIKSAAASAGVALSVLSSGTNEKLTIDAKGSGVVTIAGTSTGGISVGTSNPFTVSSAGAVAVGGTLAVTGNVGIGVASGMQALKVQGVANQFASWTIANSTTGQSFGALIDGGTNSSDSALLVRSQGQTNYFSVRGDGLVNVASTTASTSTTTGALTVGGGLGVAGAGNFGGALLANYLIVPQGNSVTFNGNGGNTYMYYDGTTIHLIKNGISVATW